MNLGMGYARRSMRAKTLIGGLVVFALQSGCASKAPTADGGTDTDSGAAAKDSGTVTDSGVLADAGAEDSGTLPLDAGTALLSVDPLELVFSGVRGTVSTAKHFELTNTGALPLSILKAQASGPGFKLSDGGTLPVQLVAGGHLALTLVFAPDGGGPIGPVSGKVQVHSDVAGDLTLSLYGLVTPGLQGANEPPLLDVVQTLGYDIDVGWSNLAGGMESTPKGDEVQVSRFVRATASEVTMDPVARYAPDEAVPFGYTSPDGGTLHPIATLVVGQEQTLLPDIQTGGKRAFNPGDAPFGLYVHDQTNARNDYTLDALNAAPQHRTRVYPLKNRQGLAVPNSYLVGFEEASNGDYQDFVFVLGNAKPAP